MKNLLFLFCLIAGVVSCTGNSGKRTRQPAMNMVTAETSNVQEEFVEDTLILVEEIIPLAADESFADFFYIFSTDEKYQSRRIVFPISVYQDSVVQKIEKDDWLYDALFSNDESYTILFHSEEEMELEKDTSHHSVQVDLLYLDSRNYKRYYFEKINGRWMLEAINYEHMQQEAGVEDFYDFYDRFSSDSLFQSTRLGQPVAFVTPDPDDEFNFVETTLDEGQWFAFQPPMMPHKLTNVIYGQKNNNSSRTKIIEYKGFGNGFCNILHFHRMDGKWYLVKFEDVGD